MTSEPTTPVVQQDRIREALLRRAGLSQAQIEEALRTERETGQQLDQVLIGKNMLPETKALPVVFITAKASQRELDELRTLGAVGTISKPFSPKDLPDQLRAIWKDLP